MCVEHRERQEGAQPRFRTVRRQMFTRLSKQLPTTSRLIRSNWTSPSGINSTQRRWNRCSKLTEKSKSHFQLRALQSLSKMTGRSR